MLTNETLKVASKFVCEKCAYNTCKKSSYDKHILTAKHRLLTKLDVIATKSCQQHMQCENCNKIYKSRVGLWYHKKKCMDESPKQSGGDCSTSLEKNIEYEKSSASVNHSGIAEKTLNMDEEFGINTDNVDITDKTLIMQLLKQNCELQKKILEMSCQPITINQTNSHNKQFNLNVFLNETCKNAMNLSDFVNSIVIQASELEDMGKLGYVQAISNIMIRSLKELDENMRPFHCTDKKREVIYIKENDVWEKETSDRAKLNQFIKDIAFRNFKRMPQWEKDNPKYEDITTKKHLEYIRMLNQVMTGLDPEELGVNKIIRNLSSHVYLDKN